MSSDDDTDIDFELLEAEEKMEKAVRVARDDFAAVRTGRPTPAMFSRIVVDYYDTPTPVQQLASFSVPEARMVIVSPYDKGSIGAIERAIRDSDLGVNPANDGNIIRCVFPELSEQRRRELVKVVRGKAEDSRVSIRSVRRHSMESLEKMKKNGDAGEDDVKRGEKELEALTHRFVAQVDELLKHKESELLEV
jgi:ribosome recycling factor